MRRRPAALAMAGWRSVKRTAGSDARADRLPRWQGRSRASACARPRWPGDFDPELGPRHGGGLARPLGDEPDADQRLDTTVRAGGAAAGGPRPGGVWQRGLEIGGIAPVRCLVGGKLAAFMSADLSKLDLLVVQIDGLHVSKDLVLVAAIGIDGEGGKHPLAVVEGVTENSATVQALLDNLVEHGLDPAVPRLFVVDGAKALSKAIRATFGRDVAIQRCQIHKACNIMDRLPKEVHASTRRALRQAWDLDDVEKAEKLIRNLAARAGPAGCRSQHPGGARRDPHRLSAEAAGRASSLAGLHQPHREHDQCHPARHREREALAQWQDGSALGCRRHDRDSQGLRKLKAHKQLPILRAALIAHQEHLAEKPVATTTRAA
jgi:putative transposase